MAGAGVRDAEPGGGEAQVEIAVDPAERFHHAPGQLVDEPPRLGAVVFREEVEVGGAARLGRFRGPELDEFLSGVRLEKRVDRVLVLDRQILSADQVVIGVGRGRGGLQQGQRGEHHMGTAPVDAETRLDKMDLGTDAAAFQRVEGGLAVDMDIDVVAGVVQQGEQGTHLRGLGMHQDQIGVFSIVHIPKISIIAGTCSRVRPDRPPSGPLRCRRPGPAAAAARRRSGSSP